MSRIQLAVALLTAVSVFHVSAVSPPSLPNSFEAEILVSLPYAHINEPVFVWFDAASSSARLDYYGGMDSYLFLGNDNITYQIVPNGINSTLCLGLEGTVAPQAIFPDLTQFSLESDSVVVDGVACANWQYVSTEDKRVNTYNFYIRKDNSMPFKYHMLGYDTLFGSHYDEYVVRYRSIIPGVNSNAFATPASSDNCQVFPPGGGPSSLREGNPLLDIMSFHPSTAGVRSAVDDKSFDDFRLKHGKSYSSAEEHRYRRSVFAHNSRFIHSTNRRGLTFKVGVNHLADLTRDERLARNNKQRPPADNGAHGVHYARGVSGLPTTVDWRDKGVVSYVKDQGICGSCFTFGAAQTIESLLAIKNRVMIPLSSQALVDCSWSFGNDACDGGLDFQCYQWIMSAGGIPTEESYPYLMADGECHFQKGDVGATAISAYINVTSGDESSLMDAVATVAPISISIDASLDTFSFYMSGVYSDSQCKNGLNDLDHTVLLVGYGTENGSPYWLVKNSWSTHWGDGGYVKIARAGNLCGVATSPTYVKLA